MYMRAVIVRIVYVGVVSAGLLLGAALRQSTVEAAPVARVTPAARQASTATALPTVTLATIQVHAARARTAMPSPVALHDLVADDDAGSQTPAISVPTLRLDMPYYSFGRMLSRAGKD